MYVVILAGGSGTRLWPRSRRDRPKHTLELVTERSMLQETFDRAHQIVPAAQILVVTEASHAGLIREQLSELPADNILVEPTRRGTGPAIGWAAVHVRRRDPESVMAVLASDHIITRPAEFLEVLLASAHEAAESDALMTMGIPPTEPSTEFGYIHRGELHAMRGGRPVYKVESFKEKPNAQLAEEFVRTSEYYWNANICCYKAAVMLDQMAQLMPELHNGLLTIAQAIGTSEEQAVLREVYPSLPKETIDTGILEKSDRVLTIPADVGWADVGTWSALHDVLANGDGGNVALGGGQLLAIDTSRTLVCSPDKLVATIGVKDLVIVDSPTALLVCERSRAAEVKLIVEQLEARGQHEHL